MKFDDFINHPSFNEQYDYEDEDEEFTFLFNKNTIFKPRKVKERYKELEKKFFYDLRSYIKDGVLKKENLVIEDNVVSQFPPYIKKIDVPHVNIFYNSSLKEFPNVEYNVETLFIKHSSIEKLPLNINRLRSFVVDNCNNIEQLPNFNNQVDVVFEHSKLRDSLHKHLNVGRLYIDGCSIDKFPISINATSNIVFTDIVRKMGDVNVFNSKIKCNQLIIRKGIVTFLADVEADSVNLVDSNFINFFKGGKIKCNTFFFPATFEGISVFDTQLDTNDLYMLKESRLVKRYGEEQTNILLNENPNINFKKVIFV